jgi:hypothetical protein
MNQHEIWYQDDNLITVVSFKGESSDIAKIKVANIKSLRREKLFEYINNYKIVLKTKNSKRL